MLLNSQWNSKNIFKSEKIDSMRYVKFEKRRSLVYHIYSNKVNKTK